MYKKPARASKVPSTRTARTHTIPAPTSGLNQRDPISAMPPLFALNLTNFIATPQGCSVREAYRVRNTGLPSYVKTLATYTPSDGTSNKIFAWSNTSIYDVSNPGAVGAAVVTGLTNAIWNTVNMSTTADQYLVCANGTDAVRHYDGTAWTTWVNDATPTLPGEIDGVSVNTLNHPITHQRRLWFVQENSSKGWYLPIDSLGGTAAAIEFGASFPRGGRLAQLASWSLDGGQGIKNFLAAVSSNGDLVIYEGTDPSSSADWSISATWKLAPPTTDDCLYPYGGDLLYNSVDGLMPLSQYMQNKQTVVALSDSIRTVFSALAESLNGLDGWSTNYITNKNLILVNVPQINPLKNIQLVYNTVTEGWSLFTGWPAQCFTSLGTSHYFGGFQEVCTAFVGYKDGADATGEGGSIYTATGQQAFNYIDDVATNKHFTAARINLTTASGSPIILLGANTDFETTPPANIGVAIPITQSLYDVAFWDQGEWVGGLTNYNAWQSVSASGYCVSVTVAVSVLAAANWVSTDLVFERGGIFS